MAEPLKLPAAMKPLALPPRPKIEIPSGNTGTFQANRFRAGLVAPSGTGKTLLAATLDPAIPDKLPAPSHTKLTRTRYVNIDGGAVHGGLDSINDMNLDVDYWDLTQMTGKQFYDAMLQVADEAKDMALAGTYDTFVIDSMSVADKIMDTYCGLKHEGEATTFKRYGELLGMHSNIFMAWRKVPANVLITFHENYVVAYDDDQKKRLESRGQKDGQAVIDITGKGYNFWVNSLSYILALKAQPGAGSEVKRYITASASDVKCKARTHKLAAQEPANLAKLVEKLYKEV